MEPKGPLVESNETHQNENNPFMALNDTNDEDDETYPRHETNGTWSCRPPQLYQPNFDSNRYDDTSEQIHIQVDDVTKVKLPRVRKCDKFDNIVHSAMMQLSL